MHSIFRDIGIRQRLQLGLGSALLLGAGAGAALATGQRLALLPVLIAVAATLALVRWIGGHVERPVVQAIESVQAMLEGRFEHRPHIDKLDELGQLLIALDRLGDHLAVALPDEALDGGPVTTPRAPMRVHADRAAGTGTTGETSLDHLIERLDEVCADIDTHVTGQGPRALGGNTPQLLQQRSAQLLKAAAALQQRGSRRQHEPA